MNKQFETWATEHQFNIDYDATRRIYTSTFTQAAYMAYEQGYSQALSDNK